MRRFGEINFGYASAEVESASAPQLLIDGYYNFGDIVSELMHGSRFLILGYKGSGKSAVAERLKLLAEDDPELFVTTMFLSDFPYTSFKRIVSGDAEPEAKYPTAWAWLLLLSLIQSFTEDVGAEFPEDSEPTLARLRQMGLLPAPTLKELVLVSSKQSFKTKVSLFEFGAERVYEGQDLQLLQLVEYLKRVVRATKTNSRHLVVIDGLDDILTHRDIQYQSIAALILEVSRLNTILSRSGAAAKVILLCRTDLFERLPGPNKNKVRQDSSLELDWYHDPRDWKSSKLTELVNLRARLADSEIMDVVSAYFPPWLERRAKDTHMSLLDLTRHTPRDYIQLLCHIQKYGDRGRLTRDQVLSGIRDYSIKYFMPELRDELVGYIPEKISNAGFAAIGSLREREFKLDDLLEQLDRQQTMTRGELEGFIHSLFDCSGLGNIHVRTSGTTYFTFKYRNRNSTLNLRERLLLHRGVWKAMNLV